MPYSSAARPGVKRSRLRLGLRGWLVMACLLLAATVGGLYLAATYRPAWYRPASVNRDLLRGDKAALVELQDLVSAALNAGREVRFELTELQVNRWLAARAEIWPNRGLEVSGLDWPQLVLRPGTVRAGATAYRGGLRAVVTLDCGLEVTDDAIRVVDVGGKLGSVPVPLDWLGGLLARLPAAANLTVDARDGAIVIANGWVWPNGKRRCRLKELRITAGAAAITLEPWP